MFHLSRSLPNAVAVAPEVSRRKTLAKTDVPVAMMMTAAIEMIDEHLVDTTMMMTEDTAPRDTMTREIIEDGQEAGNHIVDMIYTAPAGEIPHGVGQNHQSRNATNGVALDHGNVASIANDLQWPAHAPVVLQRSIVMFLAPVVVLPFQLLVLVTRIGETETGIAIGIEIEEIGRAIDQKTVSRERHVRLVRVVKPDNDTRGKRLIDTYPAPLAVRT